MKLIINNTTHIIDEILLFGASLAKHNKTRIYHSTARLPNHNTLYKFKLEQPYSLICFYGIINENTAKITNLTEEDIGLLVEGMWEGTKNLNTRTKIGQSPQLLIKINYRKDCFHIGELDKYIKIDSEIDDLKIRNIGEFTVNINDLAKIIDKHKDGIKSIDYKTGERIKLSMDISKIFQASNAINY